MCSHMLQPIRNAITTVATLTKDMPKLSDIKITINGKSENSHNYYHVAAVMFLLAVVLLALIGFLLVDGQRCTMNVTQADECGSQIIFFGDRNAFIPQNDMEMDKHCKLMFDSLKCLRKYGKTCLPPFPQQAFAIYAYDMSQVIKNRCNIPENRHKFINYAKCWHSKENLHNVSLCIDKHIVQLEYINKEVHPDLQIAAICCTYHQRHNCVKSEIAKLCSHDPENVQYVVDAIDDASKDVIEFTCGPFQSINSCYEKFNATVWKQITEVVNIDNESLLALRHKYHSGIPPSVAIITHYEM